MNRIAMSIAVVGQLRIVSGAVMKYVQLSVLLQSWTWVEQCVDLSHLVVCVRRLFCGARLAPALSALAYCAAMDDQSRNLDEFAVFVQGSKKWARHNGLCMRANS